VEDLQDKLEEARSDITQRRKDEKEWKGKERTLMIQISGVSLPTLRLQIWVDDPVRGGHLIVTAKSGEFEAESCEYAEDVQQPMR
jgi:hypothetical protein